MSRRRFVVVSDIEMGGGGVLDDFPHSAFLAELVQQWGAVDAPVDLVFNGDTFDLLKMSLAGAYPHRVTEAVALAKLARVFEAHGTFFDALARFLERGERAVHFIVGNHDLELVFPEVQRAIAARIDRPGVFFPGLSLRRGELHIEHGMQADSMFWVDPEALTMLHEGEQVLAQPWGAGAIIDVALPLQGLLYPLDRLKPRERVLATLPEVKELLVNAYWNYWTRDWWRDYWSNPSKQVSWSLLKDVVYRFGTLDTDVDVGNHYQTLVCEDPGLRVLVIGHLHRPSWWSWADRRLLTCGCFRDEYMLSTDGHVGKALPKVYADIWMEGDQVVTAELVEVRGPPLRNGMPDRLSALLPMVRPLLPSRSEQAQALAAQRGEERRDQRRVR